MADGGHAGGGRWSPLCLAGRVGGHLSPFSRWHRYPGRASVRPGEPITLYASTTGRSFTVTAFRMGWYGGDLARKVWKSGTVPGHKQNKPVVLKPANTVEARWGPSVTIPTHDWPEG